VALLALLAAAHPARAAQVGAPERYLLAAQNEDGGFGAASGQPSSSLFSGWAALGLAAAGRSPATVSHGGPTLLAYIEANPGSDPGSLERSILAIRGGGGPVAALLTHLERDLRRDGSVAELTNLTAFGILALRAAGVSPPAKTIRWLARQQDDDGGFNFATAGGQSDVDDTGAALEALAGTGRRSTDRRAVRFIDAQQNRDGGFPSQPGGDSNAQSTAFAIQGLIATGRHPRRAQAYLASLVGSGGAVDYAKGVTQSPVWVTGQAALALAGKPLPLAPPTVVAAPVARRPPAPKPAPRPARPPRRGPLLRRAAPLRRRHVQSSPHVDVDALASDAGVLAALALAPVNDP